MYLWFNGGAPPTVLHRDNRVSDTARDESGDTEFARSAQKRYRKRDGNRIKASNGTVLE